MRMLPDFPTRKRLIYSNKVVCLLNEIAAELETDSPAWVSKSYNHNYDNGALYSSNTLVQSSVKINCHRLHNSHS